MRPPSCAGSKWSLQVVQVQGKVSVRVHSGPHCLLTKFFFTLLNITFSDPFLCVSQDHRIGDQSTINKVIMSDQPRNGSVEVELGVPVAHCVEYIMDL